MSRMSVKTLRFHINLGFPFPYYYYLFFFLFFALVLMHSMWPALSGLCWQLHWSGNSLKTLEGIMFPQHPNSHLSAQPLCVSFFNPLCTSVFRAANQSYGWPRAEKLTKHWAPAPSRVTSVWSKVCQVRKTGMPLEDSFRENASELQVFVVCYEMVSSRHSQMK